jgi:O-antigen/teichoic acid export membrane protein
MLHRRMAGNAGVQLVAKAILLLVSMAGFSFLTRYLGPTQYGRYSLILNVFGIVGIIAELGLGTIGIRELAARRDKVETILPALLVARIILAILAVMAAGVLARALGYDRSLTALILLYAAIFLLRAIGAGTFGLISAAALSAWKNVAGDAVESVALLAFIAVGVVTARSLGWFVSGAVVSAAGGTLVIIVLAWRDGPRHWNIDWRYCLRLLQEAAPLAIAGLFSVIYFRLDALMLSKMSDADAVGIYGAAYKYVESASVINAIFLSSIFPVLSYCFEHDKPRFVAYYRHALEWTSAFACSLALFLYIFADPLILLLSGTAYAESAAVLRIFCGAIMGFFINNIGVHLLFAARLQKHVVSINMIAAGAKIAANLFLIPRYGPEGAAAATVLAELMIGLSVFITVRRLQGLPSPLVPLAKLGTVALAIILFLALLQPNLLQRALLLTGWVGFLLLLGIPQPRQVLKLLQGARG